LTVILLAAGLATAIAIAQPSIDLVYPRPQPGDTAIYIDRVDSNFVFGSVTPPGAGLIVNGHPVQVRPNGAFLAFLPVDWGTGRYEMTARIGEDTSLLVVSFTTRPEHEPPRPPEGPFPREIELTGGVARTDPRGAYYLFPEPGTRAVTDGWWNGYYKLPIAQGRSVWVAGRYVRDAPPTVDTDRPVLWRVGVYPDGRWVKLRLPVGRKRLYRVRDDPNSDRIIVDLYQVISHIDRIDYCPGTEPVKEVIWEQPADGLLTLTVSLSGPSWGYKATWDGGDFVLRIRRPPRLRRRVKGLHIALDPGHGGEQYGAVGPTRLTEKQINLQVADALAQLLEKKGAMVTLTRTTDTTLGLKERIDMAEQAGADILISLHHNALPDGINPLTAELGCGTYYYRPQSRNLAAAIQHELSGRLGLPDEGIYYNNLALVRPTAMLAVLVEAAYIMLPAHEEMMREADYPKRLARAVYKGLVSFVKERRK